MSQFKFQQPVQHIPSFTRWPLSQEVMAQEIKKFKLKPFPGTTEFKLDTLRYYMTLEDWGKVLYDLTFSSSLYKPDIFDCDKYALKAYITCCERYSVNTLFFCVGEVDKKMHGFNIFPYGNGRGIEGFMLFEPNDGCPFSGSAFKMGEYNYKVEWVLI